jgi:hypothetical protein
MDLNVILNSVTLALVALVGALLQSAKAGLEEGAKKGAAAAIRDIHWPVELAQALENARGVDRQELRFTSYGTLWSKLRPLALYDDKSLNTTGAAALSTALSDWYFSISGGLLLTREAREFYFALQDLLQAIGNTSPDWVARETSGDQEAALRRVLARFELKGATEVLNYMKEADFQDWLRVAPDLGKKWRADIKALGYRWTEISESERFAVLQQVGSTLRTTLTNDVESRLR